MSALAIQPERWALAKKDNRPTINRQTERIVYLRIKTKNHEKENSFWSKSPFWTNVH